MSVGDDGCEENWNDQTGYGGRLGWMRMIGMTCVRDWNDGSGT